MHPPTLKRESPSTPSVTIKEGLEFCERAIRLDPGDGQAHSNKGYALIKLKRYDEALASYEQAIQLGPNHIRYNGKGQALNGLKRHKEAEQAFEKARQLGSGE